MSTKRTLLAQKAGRQMAISNVSNQTTSCLARPGTQAAPQKRKFNCKSHILLMLCMAFFVGYGWGQATITEGFEESTTGSTTGGTGMPTGYGTGAYILSSGTWTFYQIGRAHV